LTDLQRARTEQANIASAARAAQQKADAATADAQHSQVPVDRYPDAVTPQT
jgi:peptidoglycan DL-endopeptidase RipA